MNALENTLFNFVVIIPIGTVSIIIACILNKKINSVGNKPFKYGYFLSVFTIIMSVVFVIAFIIDIGSRRYRASYYSNEITLVLLGTIFLIGIAIINIKKYKIGAILISIFTGNFIICIFYYSNRWTEFKKISEIKNKFNIKL